MKLSIIFFSLLLVSCNEQSLKSDRNCANVKEPLKPDGYNSFEDYWRQFGIATETVDSNKIVSLVEVPLRIIGREDLDPEFKLNSDVLAKYVFYLINNGGYYDYEKDSSISNRSLILSSLKSIPEYDKEKEIQCIKDFVFKKTRNGWKLVIIYTDTKDLMERLK